jgi:PEP-CTERM/exosortase A-associated glycosyltransferase
MEKSPLRILHILDHCLPVHSGYAFRSQAILLAQMRRGWKPAMLTSAKHYESWKGPWQDREQVGDICCYRSPVVARSPWPLSTEIRIMTSLARRLLTLAKQEKPHVLHAHSPILNAVPALWVSRRLGIPVVYEMRALWEDAAVDHGTYGERSWKYKLVKSVETWICRRADHVAVLCDGLRNELIERGIASAKLTVIPNGVDTQAFGIARLDRSLLSQWNLCNRKVIGFIGSFFRYEGLDLLVKAIACVTRSRPDVALLLVGGGETEDELKAQIKRLRLQDKVIMTGPVSPERIPEVYALIDILAYPRRSMRLTELVTPLKPLEAMAMSKAIVASNIGGHRELIQDGYTGLLFTASSVSSLVTALERLLDNADLRQALGIQGAAWVRQERSWDKTTADYSSVYSEALRKYPRRSGRWYT